MPCGIILRTVGGRRRCDDTKTPQAGIDRGIVNVVVGFAPLKPAEFVILTLRGQGASAGAVLP
jgi:hypothetical protein